MSCTPISLSVAEAAEDVLFFPVALLGVACMLGQGILQESAAHASQVQD